MKNLILIFTLLLISYQSKAQISNQTATDSLPNSTLFLVSQFYGGVWNSHKLTAETLRDSILASLGTGSVTTVHILDATIDSTDIKDNGISNADIQNSTLTQAKFSNALTIDGIVHTLVKDTIDTKLAKAGGTMTGNIVFNSTQTIDGITHSLLKDTIDDKASLTLTNTFSGTNVFNNPVSIDSIISTSSDAELDWRFGVMRIPSVVYASDTTIGQAMYTEITADGYHRLRILAVDSSETPNTEVYFWTVDEQVDKFKQGTSSFTTTATTCSVTVSGGTASDIYVATPIGTTWNANDMLIVSGYEGGFLVTRNSGGTSGLQFHWMRGRYY